MAELIIAIADLLEAEGRALRQGVGRLVAAGVLGRRVHVLGQHQREPAPGTVDETPDQD